MTGSGIAGDVGDGVAGTKSGEDQDQIVSSAPAGREGVEGSSMAGPVSGGMTGAGVVEDEGIPEGKTLDIMLDKLMDSLGVPMQRRQEVRSLSKERKWQLVQISVKHLPGAHRAPAVATLGRTKVPYPPKETKATVGVGGLVAATTTAVDDQQDGVNWQQWQCSPQTFIVTLMNPRTHSAPARFFSDLRVCITTEPKRWTTQFMASGGLDHLANYANEVMKKVSKQTSDWKTIYEIVKTLKVLASDTDVLPSFLENRLLLSNLSRLAFHHKLSPPTPRPARPSSQTPQSAFAGTNTIPPLEYRKALVDLLAHITPRQPDDGWRAVVAALDDDVPPPAGTALVHNEGPTKADDAHAGGSARARPQPEQPASSVGAAGGTEEELHVRSSRRFAALMAEFEAVVVERVRVWNGSARRAADVFNALADGTYRWQPIVQAPVCATTEKAAVEYIVRSLPGDPFFMSKTDLYLLKQMSILKLLSALYENVPGGTAQARADLRDELNSHRLEQIYQRLRHCPNIPLTRLLKSIRDQNQADQNTVLTDTLDPTTHAGSEVVIAPAAEGDISESATVGRRIRQSGAATALAVDGASATEDATAAVGRVARAAEETREEARDDASRAVLRGDTRPDGGERLSGASGDGEGAKHIKRKKRVQLRFTGCPLNESEGSSSSSPSGSVEDGVDGAEDEAVNPAWAQVDGR
ncbi:hypothetical protein HK101_009979 [Irineochytrium annulatum]|nr:hypothetical protein HK101_009979 [Irineochytrium annulatum]